MKVEKTEKGVWIGNGDGGFNVSKDIALQLARRIIELCGDESAENAQPQTDVLCVHCGKPYSEHNGRYKFCKDMPHAFASR
jgi:hypothetical protein